MSATFPAAGGRSRRGRVPKPTWSESEEDSAITESALVGANAASDRKHDELRQLAARRKLEQYMESKRLREQLQEIYLDEER